MYIYFCRKMASLFYICLMKSYKIKKYYFLTFTVKTVFTLFYKRLLFLVEFKTIMYYIFPKFVKCIIK